MTDELITKLAAVGDLRVISRTSVMRYKGARTPVADIARVLHVDALVEGSVVRSADRVRVNVQLIHAASDHHLWARSYEDTFVDVVKLQNRIASAIADEIHVKLTSPDRARLASAHAVNPQAYEMYLKGRYHWNKRTESELRQGLRYFEQAVDVDPQYAYGYVGLADTYNILGSWVFNAVPPADAGRKAEQYARQALGLDPSLGEAHAAIGDAIFLFERNWEAARQEFESAIALSPGYANAHHWYGEYLCDIGQFDRAIEESRKALGLDPLAPILGIALGGRLHIAGRDDEALYALRDVLELDPNIPVLRSTLGEVYESKGMFPEAVGEFERAIELMPQDVKDALRAGQVDLNDPAVTIQLLKLNAVVGVIGKVVGANDHLATIGITCALCHSTVDNSFADGIGKRLDGWPNRTLNVGAIVALSPVITDKSPYRSWGPGKFDPRFHIFDGTNLIQINSPTIPVVLPPAFGLQGVGFETFDGDGRISYWNNYVGVAEMGGHGSFSDPRIGVSITQTPDLVTPKLPALLQYQLSLQTPPPPKGSFNQAAARRGADVFAGAGQCATCHKPPTFTDVLSGPDPRTPFLHAPSEIPTEPAYAARSATKQWRTTPLRALWQHPPYFHDGSAPDLLAVVNRYDAFFSLGLSDKQKADLVEFLKTL